MRLAALRALAQDATMDPASGMFFGTGQTDVTSPVNASMQAPSYAAPPPPPPLVVLPPITADTTAPPSVSTFTPGSVTSAILSFTSPVAQAPTPAQPAPPSASPALPLLLIAAAGLGLILWVR
jgi:hypothetical protein